MFSRLRSRRLNGKRNQGKEKENKLTPSRHRNNPGLISPQLCISRKAGQRGWTTLSGHHSILAYLR
jgi:hypothetical protein